MIEQLAHELFLDYKQETESLNQEGMVDYANSLLSDAATNPALQEALLVNGLLDTLRDITNTTP